MHKHEPTMQPSLIHILTGPEVYSMAILGGATQGKATALLGKALCTYVLFFSYMLPSECGSTGVPQSLSS